MPTSDRFSEVDRRHMTAALTLARRGLGAVAPNPAVGCVLVREGRVVGRGWTQAGGRPHAETEALARAGVAAKGATAYVTLEPCSHHGKTGPCADALVKAGVARVVIATIDPDPRVSGRGVAMLEAAGVRVDVGCLECEAQAVNAGFFGRLDGRPTVTLKLATSLDGKIATRTGDSQWITGEVARARSHLLRAEHDAVMVGVGTAIADNPQLTCRLPGLSGRSPVRVVADGRLRLPLTHILVRTARDVPTILFTNQGNPSERRQAYVKAGVEVIELTGDGLGRPDPAKAMKCLADRGITRVMVEGGGQLAASMVHADLVDRVYWFRGSCVIGEEGRPAVAALGLDKLAKAPTYALDAVERLGDDLLEIYRLSR
ncbi:bifunctional diaminohydroxyphosphoribosylaminopyrimidine deaminase/5-amino-6-(5-phosphoribosylamino)uracil reductase RibD [Zavarzinia compransoris]|uniref:bifunctional diaminohydroxyphosphoribosylaminopyrimidine deaminase/5-amino-6-(5-phosphoribosylamino)uracil reductase RibD n=1 Tax=Zavarzinia marina TaxID=2911065 RepID=UPI001EED9C1A|nr:bifunctional diaminohydroxyphosphoribosylaminopyrimidine deaminase/5-amino-6-(5-phosphoribosylamino)uracil reductase RibD [Zavarzinia marina]MCF4164476.1 bifunctional diaminohydroxyphosphoribosylaminopyrimidine deaminase/5-amino-6-(5-phosphoribosylamino)uracil reductase RibD [Zavarzinia marina]